MSSGNKFTEIKLNKAKQTLIVGHNGAGKSTALDALSFALFGKAHRNINKPQLVNSINKKNCVVEVEFIIGKNSYKVIRGIHPGIFEIWINGELLNQSSHSKEYQKILEQNILKLSHKSFHQVVVLGSSSFIPFMQLSAFHRRSVIEDLLDINVFSKMNYLIKEQISILREKIRDLSHDIEIQDTKKKSQRKYIDDLTKLNSSHRKEKQDYIEQLQKEVAELCSVNEELTNKINTISPDLQENSKKYNDHKQSILHDNGILTSDIKAIVKEAKFYEKHVSCPTCKQDLDEDTRSSAIEIAKEKARLLKNKKETLEKAYSKVEEELQRINETFNKIQELQNTVNKNITLISSSQKNIANTEKELNKLSAASSDIENAKKELEKIEKARQSLIDEKLASTESFQYNTVMAEMLKDTGIKTKVIKQYLPIINTLVNQYLQVLDFFVSFQLDEAFNEEIRSRHRDTFSYDSFSEGEKQRIDLALLFTWRQVAQMMNSVSTNLLILDETFDSSLDHDGVENLMKILYTLDDNTNVFVISHKGEILEGKFEKKIEFEKKKNFSVMKEF